MSRLGLRSLLCCAGGCPSGGDSVPSSSTEGRQAGSTEGRQAGSTEGRQAGSTEGRQAGSTEGRPDESRPTTTLPPHYQPPKESLHDLAENPDPTRSADPDRGIVGTDGLYALAAQLRSRRAGLAQCRR